MTRTNEPHKAIEHFREAYERACDTHKQLPPLDDFDHEFDVFEAIGRERHFPQNAARYARWHMLRTINNWGGFLHEFILPNQQSAVSMEEYNYFDEKEKQEVIAIMNWLMYRNRTAGLLQIDEDDTKNAQFIADVWKEWHARKPQLRALMKKSADIWKGKIEEKMR